MGGSSKITLILTGMIPSGTWSWGTTTKMNSPPTTILPANLFCATTGSLLFPAPLGRDRLYAVTGRADGSKDNKTIPIYNLPAFVRKLDAKKVSWDWYSDNFFGSTLNLTDGRYRSRSVYDLDHFYRQAADGTLPSVCSMRSALCQ